MDFKKSSITADILNALSDGKIHTLQEIADEIEVSKITVYRHIQSLSYRYPIQSFCGGINRGGVYLDKDYIYQLTFAQIYLLLYTSKPYINTSKIASIFSFAVNSRNL